MQISSIPKKIAAIFGASAPSADINTIPDTQAGIAQPGQASFDVGFPAITMQPKASGGIPPYGQDFNGLGNAITAPLQWMCAGGQFPYDATFSSAIGGYPKGAKLIKADYSGFWLSTVDNNTSNPDTGGAGWFDMQTGVKTQVFTSSGTYTPTAGLIYANVKAVGGGGGGGGVDGSSVSASVSGGGGGGGGYSESVLTASVIGASQIVTIGAGGAGPVSGANPGVAGGATSFGDLVIANGGLGGNYAVMSGSATAQPTLGGAPGTGNVIASPGSIGGGGFYSNANVVTYPGIGAGGLYGAGGLQKADTRGGDATGYGSGGGGGDAYSINNAFGGGNGAPGLIIITEYVGAPS